MSDSKDPTSSIQAPPTGFFATLRRIGPGLIIAGSIVGSGELIATTLTGARAGFWLLWLVAIGCVIKMFVQVELGRYTVSSGETTIAAMDRVPGPRIGNRGNWVIWYWFIMFVASVAQLGGIIGGVGQALAISLPLTQQGREYDEFAKRDTRLQVQISQLSRIVPGPTDPETLVAANDPSLPMTLAVLDDYSELATMIDSRWERESASISTDELTDEQLRAAVDQQQAYLDRRTILIEWQRAIDNKRELLRRVTNENPLTQEQSTELRQLQRQLMQWAAWKRAAEKLTTAETSLKNTPESRTARRETLTRDVEAAKAAETQAWSDALALDGAWGNEFNQASEAQRLLRTGVDSVPRSKDDQWWAAIIAVITALILMKGRFGLILSFSTAMVATFTAVTIINLVILQRHDAWAVSLNDLIDGFRFRLPPSDSGDRWAAVSTALKTFGIIGVGATELVSYPYWCLEQGYARYTGPKDDSEGWTTRAKGWIRVMWVDAWGSMLIYTFATIAFYLLGASVLGRSGVAVSEQSLIRYLTVMFEPVFGSSARIMFLFGAFAVLYSTLFVASAGHARVFSDALRVLRLVPSTTRAYDWSVFILSGAFPMISLAIYIVFPKPTFLVLLSGLMQLIMLPMLSTTALYLRYTRLDPRLRPGWLSDAGLWISSVGLLVAGIAGGWLAGSELLKNW